MNEEADAQVRAFMEILKKDYGIDPNDLKEIIARHKQISKIGDWAARGIVSGLVFGGLLALWEGFKHLVKVGGH